MSDATDDTEGAAPSNEQRKLQAQVRMMRLAEDFLRVLPPRDVITLFTGPAIWLLTTGLGPDSAAAYLRECANELESEAGTGHGHA